MITFRCTKKMLEAFDIKLTEPLLPTTSMLGDWYANWIPTHAGDLILIVNEKTLLTVAIPVWESANLITMFRMRVYNLLRLIGISARAASQELDHYDDVQFAKTASRRVLGSMNDFASMVQCRVAPEIGQVNYSISDMEVWLSDTPCKPLGYSCPQETARELLERE